MLRRGVRHPMPSARAAGCVTRVAKSATLRHTRLPPPAPDGICLTGLLRQHAQRAPVTGERSARHMGRRQGQAGTTLLSASASPGSPTTCPGRLCAWLLSRGDPSDANDCPGQSFASRRRRSRSDASRSRRSEGRDPERSCREETRLTPMTALGSRLRHANGGIGTAASCRTTARHLRACIARTD